MRQVNFNFPYKLIDFFGILSTLAPPPTPPLLGVQAETAGGWDVLFLFAPGALSSGLSTGTEDMLHFLIADD